MIALCSTSPEKECLYNKVSTLTSRCSLSLSVKFPDLSKMSVIRRHSVFIIKSQIMVGASSLVSIFHSTSKQLAPESAVSLQGPWIVLQLVRISHRSSGGSRSLCGKLVFHCVWRVYESLTRRFKEGNAMKQGKRLWAARYLMIIGCRLFVYRYPINKKKGNENIPLNVIDLSNALISRKTDNIISIVTHREVPLWILRNVVRISFFSRWQCIKLAHGTKECSSKRDISLCRRRAFCIDSQL